MAKDRKWVIFLDFFALGLGMPLPGSWEASEHCPLWRLGSWAGPVGTVVWEETQVGGPHHLTTHTHTMLDASGRTWSASLGQNLIHGILLQDRLSALLEFRGGGVCAGRGKAGPPEVVMLSTHIQSLAGNQEWAKSWRGMKSSYGFFLLWKESMLGSKQISPTGSIVCSSLRTLVRCLDWWILTTLFANQD